MRKGNIVRLKDDRVAGPAHLWRRATAAETEEWRAARRGEIEKARAAGEDTFHIAFDCAGESRLPPMDATRAPMEGEVFKVMRSRARAPYGYGAESGCVLLVDSKGAEWFTRRANVDFAEKVEAVPESTVSTVDTWKEARALTLTKDDVKAGIAAWVVRVNEMRRDRCLLRFGEAFAADYHHDVVVKGGRKWVKLAAGTTVFCFVEATTGEIYKAAGWKGPATNFPRGNVFVEDVTEAEKRGGHYA